MLQPMRTCTEPSYVVDGRYRLGRLVHRSAAASVYEATHRNGASAWIKLAASPAHARLFDVEVALAKTHASALSVRDDGITEDGLPYLVIDSLVGQSLAQRMTARHPPARMIHDAISADGRDRSEKGARRTAEPRRTVRTSQAQGAPYALRSERIGTSEWSRRESSGLSAAEVVRIGAALVRAVAVLHHEGYALGALDARSVFVTEECEIMLLDFSCISELSEKTAAVDASLMNSLVQSMLATLPENERNAAARAPELRPWHSAAVIDRFQVDASSRRSARSGPEQPLPALRTAPQPPTMKSRQIESGFARSFVIGIACAVLAVAATCFAMNATAGTRSHGASARAPDDDAQPVIELDEAPTPCITQ
ncbi:MAG: hypothetical protein FWD73_14345 [Polyangiaceae bacterium]|nr:hypothetical protein [Polyangiaceae bacterium]